MNIKNFAPCLAICFVIFIECGSVNNDKKKSDNITTLQGEMDFFTIDGNEWMSENLNINKYRNGDTIPQVQDHAMWLKMRTGAWCYNINKNEIGGNYGKLYNWYAISDRRGLAPTGWHIASKKDWESLVSFLGGTEKAGGKMKAGYGWMEPNIVELKNSGFLAFPGGYCGKAGFNDLGQKNDSGLWWSSSEDLNDDELAWYYSLYNGHTQVLNGRTMKCYGLSIRCVKD